MTRLAFSLLVAALAVTPGFGQDRDQPQRTRDAATSRQRENAEENRTDRQRTSGDQIRRAYGRGQLEVKDPAGFWETQGKQIFSGPQPGEELPPLKVTGIISQQDGKSIDIIQRTGDDPHMLVFMDDGGVGLRGLYGVATMLAEINQQAKSDIRLSVIFLSDDPDAVSDRFAGLARHMGERLSDEMIVGICAEGRNGPGAYGLDRNVSQTMIFAKDAKVTHNFVFQQGMLYPDPHVLGAMAAVVGAPRETLAAWLNKAPDDGAQMHAVEAGASSLIRRQAAFRERLGALIEAGKLTRVEAGELYRLAFPENAEPERIRDRDETRESKQQAAAVEDWEAKYQQLLKDRPEIKNKVDSGQATKEQVIQWLKAGGDRKTSKAGYPRGKVELKDPAGFADTQDRPIFSGPQPGEPLPPLRVTGIHGPLEGKEFDINQLADRKPQVVILTDEGVVGLKGILGLTNFTPTIAGRADSGLHVAAVMLVDDRSTISNVLNEFAKGDLNHRLDVIGVTRDGRDGPGIYGLNRNVAQTVILAKGGMVTHNFVFPQGMSYYTDPHLLGALAELVGEDRETLAAWLNESPEKDDYR